MANQQRDAQFRSYLPWVGVAQVLLGLVGVGIALVTENLLLLVLSILLACWFWIPVAIGAKNKQGFRRLLLVGIVVLVVAMAVGLLLSFTLLSGEHAPFVALAIGLGGILCAVLPMLIAFFMSGDPQPQGSRQQWFPNLLQAGSTTADGVQMTWDADSAPETLAVTVDVTDDKFLNLDAEFEVIALAEVDDSRAVNKKKTLYSKRLVLTGSRTEFTVPSAAIDGFSYQGKKVSVMLYGTLKINDGILWDTTLKQPLRGRELERVAHAGSAKQQADPKDYFCLASNFLAIPLRRKIATLALGVVALVVIAVNSVVGYHDQFSAEGENYFYSLEDSDGDSQSPLANSLMLSGGAGAAVWLAIRRQLRGYMVFKFTRPPKRITRDTEVLVKELVHGRSGVDLKDTTVRVVAYNLEKGQYTRGSGSNTRTVSFSEPSRAVVLYEKHLALAPRRTNIEGLLEGSFSFRPMFDVLYPPNVVTKTHGLFVQWEVQLLHNKLVDQELIATGSEFRVEDFHYSGTTRGGAAGG